MATGSQLDAPPTIGGCTSVARYRRKIPASIRRAVYERDSWSCRLCGLHIPPCTDDERAGRHAPSLPTHVHEPYLWLELDHRTPHTRGGADTVDNLQAACSPCNRAKSDT